MQGLLLHVRPCLCTKAEWHNHRASLLGQLAPNKRPIELCSLRAGGWVEGGGSEGRGLVLALGMAFDSALIKGCETQPSPAHSSVSRGGGGGAGLAERRPAGDMHA